MATHRIKNAAQVTVAFFAIPWAAFVVVFMFYAGLTIVAIGVEQLPDVPVAAAYLLPAAAYGLLIVTRAVRALAAMPVQIGQLAVPRLQ